MYITVYLGASYGNDLDFRKEIRKPCIFYNIKGYYDNIQKMLETMVSFGLSTHLKQNNIFFVDDVDKIDTVLEYYY